VVPANDTATPGPQPGAAGSGTGSEQPIQTTPAATATPVPETPAEPAEPEPETDGGAGPGDSIASDGTDGGNSGATDDSDTPQTDGKPTSGVAGSTNASVQ
jgi:hypothetical protein